MENGKLSLTRVTEIIVPALVVFAVSWGVFTTRINATEKEIGELQVKYDALLSIREDIAVIKNDIGYIKEKLK